MADQIIDIPGVGQVAFPDTMSDADVAAASHKLYSDALTQKQHAVKTVSPDDFTPKSFGGMVANGFNDLENLAQTVRHPIDAVVNAAKAKQATDAQMADEAVHPKSAAYAMPGDRLADAFKRVPGIFYQHPVNSTMEAATVGAPFASSAADGVAAVAPRAAALARKAAPVASTSAIGALEGYSHFGWPGALAGAVGAPVGLRGLIGMLKRNAPGEAAATEAETAAAATAPKAIDTMAAGMKAAGAQGRQRYNDLAAADRMVRGMSAAGQPTPAVVDPIAAGMSSAGNLDQVARDRIAMGMSNAGRAAASTNFGGRLAASHAESAPIEDAVQAGLDSLKRPNQLPGVAAPSTAEGTLHEGNMHVAEQPAVQRELRRQAREASAPQRQADVDAQAANFRAAEAHGVGGFSGLPTLSQSEMERIARNIDRIRRGGGQETTVETPVGPLRSAAASVPASGLPSVSDARMEELARIFNGTSTVPAPVSGSLRQQLEATLREREMRAGR